MRTASVVRSIFQVDRIASIGGGAWPGPGPRTRLAIAAGIFSLRLSDGIDTWTTFTIHRLHLPPRCCTVCTRTRRTKYTLVIIAIICSICNYRQVIIKRQTLYIKEIIINSKSDEAITIRRTCNVTAILIDRTPYGCHNMY